MAPIPAVTFASLKDYTALPTFRTICGSSSTKFKVTALPALDISSLLEESAQLSKEDFRIVKSKIATASPPVPVRVVSLMVTLHSLAAGIFNNVSHALELPWEKYLSEMHEFGADGDDELCVFKSGEVKRSWSTLIFVFEPTNPTTCLVEFGEAMSVFSEGLISAGSSPVIDVHTPMHGSNSINGFKNAEKIVYYVRPNKGVFYTRGAGALMTPLSDQEFAERKRVGDLDISLELE